MKKPTKTILKKKIDKLFSWIVRSKGYCVKCNKTERLNAAHIFPRTNLAVRWDFNNVLALCYHCHFHWAHKNPIMFTEFVKDYLGKYRYARLKQQAKAKKVWTIEELESFYKILCEMKGGE